MLDVIIIVIIVFIGFFNIKSIKLISQKEKKYLNILWVYHILFGIIYFLYVKENGGDALSYWYSVKSLDNSLVSYLLMGPGTNFVHVINYVPSRLLELSFFTGSLIYSYIGFIGFLFYYRLFVNQIKFNVSFAGFNLFPLIFFLPNLHFWSSGIGKDTLIFFCIGMFFYSIQAPYKSFVKIVFALILSYFLRPHITVFLIASIGLGYAFSGKLKLYQNVFLVIFILGIFFLLFDNIMAYLNLESFDSETINQFSETRSSNLSRSHTGSAVDISNYSYPLKLFTFLYRPLFLDVNGALAVVASFENLLLLLFSVKFILLNPIILFRNSNYIFKGMFLFLLFGVITFPQILGNLGIMLRQKNMFTPSLLFLCLWAFSYSHEQKYLIKG